MPNMCACVIFDISFKAFVWDVYNK